jgi:hypothetical protein
MNMPTSDLPEGPFTVKWSTDRRYAAPAVVSPAGSDDPEVVERRWYEG